MASDAELRDIYDIQYCTKIFLYDFFKCLYKEVRRTLTTFCYKINRFMNKVTNVMPCLWQSQSSNFERWVRKDFILKYVFNKVEQLQKVEINRGQFTSTATSNIQIVLFGNFKYFCGFCCRTIFCGIDLQNCSCNNLK